MGKIIPERRNKNIPIKENREFEHAKHCAHLCQKKCLKCSKSLNQNDGHLTLNISRLESLAVGQR